jgi:DNA-binding protein
MTIRNTQGKYKAIKIKTEDTETEKKLSSVSTIVILKEG